MVTVGRSQWCPAELAKRPDTRPLVPVDTAANCRALMALSPCPTASAIDALDRRITHDRAPLAVPLGRDEDANGQIV